MKLNRNQQWSVHTTRSESRRTNYRVVLGLITLVGCAVLLGWHFHIRTLVQIVPGVIPMQYNTALCFVVLGLSSLLIIDRRFHQLVSIAGGTFLMIMGILVVYQYFTGTSLGIDTLLFYPWDQTLLKYPGRMALTTSVSFASSGIGIILLSLRRRALAAFALLCTLPLSFGLTSSIGYIAGITFVLPFHLGSQMAVHTALAFTAYGTVMLAFAWAETPRTSAGLPKWAPYVGSLMLPMLFLGVGITAQQNTALGLVVPLLIGLIAAALFAIAALLMSHLRVHHKGLILIAFPLAFVLIFIIFVTQISRNSERAQASYLHSRDVLLETQTILSGLFEAEASTRGYVMTPKPVFIEDFHRASKTIAEGSLRLNRLVQNDPIQRPTAFDFSTKAAQQVMALEELMRLVDLGDRTAAIKALENRADLRFTSEFQAVAKKLSDAQQASERNRQGVMQNTWQRFNWVLVSGGTMAIFLVLMLAILFSAGISKRIAALAENAREVAAGRPLTRSPLKGTDEIAKLDKVLRNMAHEVAEAAKKERAVFENALDIICSTDADGIFLKMSPSSSKIWGFQPQEMIGRHFTEFLVAEDVDKSTAVSRSLVGGPALTDFENRYRRKDGSIADMLWSAWWSETDQAVVAMARDISERKKAEAALRESEERYRMLFEGNPHPIWVFDLESLQFLAVNEAAVNRYGYSRDDFMGMTIKDIRPDEDVPRLLENVAAPSSPDSPNKTWRHRKKNGDIIEVEIESHQIRFAGRNAEIVLAHDVTEQSQMKAALQKANDTLERRVKERTKEITRLNRTLENRVVERTKALEAANKELEAFSYSVSHDLRAPLRAIDGFSRILLEDHADEMGEDGNRLLGVVRKNAQSMGQLIDDLLAFSRLGRKPVELAPIDMTNLAKSVSTELTASMSDRFPEITIDNLPSANGDVALLRQVFVNLLSNATKYSRLQEKPTIEVGGATQNGNNLYYVKDNGAGFNMKYANKLFGVFQRLHGPEEFEGTGVGLAIVQRIVHRHGGTVWAEAEVNRGATFYFTLPREISSDGNTDQHERG